MTTTRPPAVAGLFYPGDREQLRSAVRRFVAAAPAEDPGAPLRPPKAIIVPHAGYRYSGAVAGAGFRRVLPLRGAVTRVVLLGPAHYVAVPGLAVPSVDELGTPLGPLRIDTATLTGLAEMPQVTVSDLAHAMEHSVEVQLPFVVETLGAVAVAPIVVGDASSAEVAEVLERVWGGPETLIVLSTDLSHFLPDGAARRMDGDTVVAIEHLDCSEIDGRHACGWRALCGLLLVARRRGLTCHLLEFSNSGEASGRRDSVVGYGAFALTEP